MNKPESTHPFILQVSAKLRALEAAETAFQDAKYAVAETGADLIESILSDKSMARECLSINRRTLKRILRDNR
jgi:IS5 family transposase